MAGVRKAGVAVERITHKFGELFNTKGQQVSRFSDGEGFKD